MTTKELEDLNNDIIFVIDHLVEMAARFAAAIKPDASFFEVRGMVLSAMFEGLKEYEHKNGQQLPKISQTQISEATEDRSGTFQKTGSARREEASAEGDSQDAENETSGDDSVKQEG